MQAVKMRSKAGAWVLAIAGIALVLFAWPLIRQLLTQVALGYALMALALPLARRFEKKLKPGLAASLSLTALMALLVLFVLVCVPLFISQGRQLGEMLPFLIEKANAALESLKHFLGERGIEIRGITDTQMDQQINQLMQAAFPVVLKKAGSMAGALSSVFPAPILAFYFLKDRESIACHLSMWVPLKHRAKAVSAAREMKREISGFLRGQLLISAAVGGLTALGLLIAGVPAWLVLGILMGIFELIPYIGPVIASVPIVMFALAGGMTQVFWALVTVVAVQQLESGVIAPKLMSGATNLHPVWVLLAISAGGILGGVMGMLIALPVVVSLRGAFRVLRLKNAAPSKRGF